MLANYSSKRESIHDAIVEMLARRLGRPDLGETIDTSTELLAMGLIDSTDLLDIILELEERCAVEFDPEQIDFEAGLTLGSLISAFNHGRIVVPTREEAASDLS
jgi:acyl carrier protein